jgi:hypothetical protein
MKGDGVRANGWLGWIGALPTPPSAAADPPARSDIFPKVGRLQNVGVVVDAAVALVYLLSSRNLQMVGSRIASVASAASDCVPICHKTILSINATDG